MMDWAYLMITVNPQRILLQLNADLINVIYRKIMQIRGLDSGKDLLPDIGDLLIKADATGDGTKIGLSLRLSDGFYMCLDFPRGKMSKERVDIANEFGLSKNSEGKIDGYIEILSLDINSLINGGAFDLSALKLPTVGLHAGVTLKIESGGLKPSDANYQYSLANWITSLVGQLLDGTSIFGKFVALSDNEKNPNHADYYTGKTYNYNATDRKYDIVGEGQGNYKFVAANIDVYMPTAPTEIIVELNANINLGAFLTMGIGGLLYSDIALDIKAGAPINSTIIALYYLGSSRLVQNSTTHTWEMVDASEVGAGENSIFSDALYIDATRTQA